MSNLIFILNIGLSYKDVGVDIEVGDVLVDCIKFVVKCIICFEVMGGLGGFGVFCKIFKGYEEFVFVFGIDGVGIKLCLVLNLNCYDMIG